MIKKEFLYLGWYLLLCIPVIIFYVRYSSKSKREWLTLIGQIKPRATAATTGEEKRKYIRLESTFPVEFQKIDESEKDIPVHQGFTKDISREGMAIEAVVAHGRRISDFIPDRTRLRLFVNIPEDAQTTVTQVTVRWVRKTEGVNIDRYSIGVSYDDIKEPDLVRIVKYALWFRRRPDFFAITVVAIAMLMAALLVTIMVFRGTTSQLERRLANLDEERTRLAAETEVIQREKEELEKDLEATSRQYTTLWESFQRGGGERVRTKSRLAEEKAAEPILPELPEEKPIAEDEETFEAEIAEPEEVAEEDLEPVVEMRKAASAEDEIVVKPNITRKMIDSEKDAYKAFRDYILDEEIQLLDRYCSDHKTSIYHVAGLFALAELRYKNRHIKEMTIKAYRDVIRIYSRSKYASYASHRLDQLDKNLPYTAYTLKYFYIEYNLPPLYDYRELEPYKK